MYRRMRERARRVKEADRPRPQSHSQNESPPRSHATRGQRPQGETTRPSRNETTAAGSDLRSIARWMDYHESTLMPARRRGGESEVRRVLLTAREAGQIALTDSQIEQEVKDVMASPDVR